jgi:hypothetical protein
MYATLSLITTGFDFLLPFACGQFLSETPGSVDDVPVTSTAVVTPQARRAARPSWKDPRLVAGVVIVAGSIVLGSRLLGAADDSVAVWTVAENLAEGTPIGEAHVVARDVRFADAAIADRYVSAGSALPPGSVLLRDLAAGELLPRGALGSAEAVSLVEVPLAVPVAAVPATVQAGAVVDVWVTPDREALAPSGPRQDSVRVFDDVTVVAAARDATALGPASTRQVIIGFPADDDERLASALAELATGAVVIVRQA